MKTRVYAASLVAILLVLSAIPAWAGQGVGTSPYTADLLVSGLNTGELRPGQEYWYAYSRLDLGDSAYNSVILSLNFEAEGRAIASRVNFQIFDFEQVETWLKDSSSPLETLGLGTPASADFDVNTGERFWAGPIEATEVYYVRIFNLSPSPVQFRLTALGQKSVQIEAFLTMSKADLGEQEVIPAAAVSPSVDTTGEIESRVETVAALLNSQSSSATTLPVQPADSPASTRWLLAAQAIDGLPPNEAAAWLMSAAALGWLPLGNASPALLPVDPNAGVRLAVVPPDGGSGAEASEAAVPAPPPDPSTGENIYPGESLNLLYGTNTGRLAPKAEHWYTFSAGNIDHKTVEPFSLTMFFTPGEPNLARYVTFEMFTDNQYQLWERGTANDMEHFGVGSWVSRDGDYNTGERLWHGTVVDRGKYFVKIKNDTNRWIDYHLMTGDIYNAELGPTPPKSGSAGWQLRK